MAFAAGEATVCHEEAALDMGRKAAREEVLTASAAAVRPEEERVETSAPERARP